MSKLLTIAGKTLKEAVRQPKNLAITLGLPIAFMLIFGLAFGSNDPTTFSLALVDHDGTDMSRAYATGLSEMEYDGGEPIFETTRSTDEAAARAAVAAGDADALVIIPEGFAQRATPQGSPPSQPALPLAGQQGSPPTVEGAVVAIVGDPSKVDFQTASQILVAFTAAFSEEVMGPAPVKTETEAVTASELTAFDFIAPGLMVFAMLNMVPQAASVLAREAETKTLDRVRMSPTSAWSLLGGVAIAQLVLATVSLALMLATARLMGFHNQGTYWGAYVIAIGAAFAVVGLGMIIAAFARTQQEAANFGILVSVPASFLSGSFFAIPAFTLLGVNVYDLLPTTHAVRAMKQVMTLGQPIDAVSGAIGWLAILALVYFAAGVTLYRRTRLTPE